ncbi:MAG: hypothetical protein QXK45_03855 [Thermofilaceae archaeon]
MTNRKKVIDFLLENAGRFEPPPVENLTTTSREPLIFQQTTLTFTEVLGTKTVSGGTPTARRTLSVPFSTIIPTYTARLPTSPNVSASGKSVVIGAPPSPPTTMEIWGTAYWKARFSAGGNVRLVPTPVKLDFGSLVGAWMPDSSGQRALAVPNYISVAMYTMSPRTPMEQGRITLYSFGVDSKELAEAVWGTISDADTKLPGLGAVIRNMTNKAWDTVILAMKSAGMPDSAIEEANIRLRRIGFDVDKIVQLARAFFMLQLASNLKTTPQRFYVEGTDKAAFAAAAPRVRAAVELLTNQAFTAVNDAVQRTIAFANGLISVSTEMALSVLGTGKYSRGGENEFVEVTFSVENKDMATISRSGNTTTITLKEGIWFQSVSEGGWVRARIAGSNYVMPWTEHAWDALATQLSKMANDLMNPIDLVRDFSPSFFQSQLQDNIKRAGLDTFTVPTWEVGMGLLDYARSVAQRIETSPLSGADKERLREILANWTNFVGSVFTNMGITNVKEIEKAVSEVLSGLRTHAAWGPIIMVQPNILALAASLASRLRTTPGFPSTEPTFEPWPGSGILPEPTFGPTEQPL